MPPTISSISAFKQNITGAGAWDALAAVSGDSLAVADFADGSRAYIEELITGASNVTAQVYYENLPGSSQLLASWEQVRQNFVKGLGIEVTVSPGSAGQPGTAV